MLNDTADQRCTIQRPNGSFCDSESAPWAPFPICAYHARRLYEVASDLVSHPISQLTARHELANTAITKWRTDGEQREEDCTVYYADVRGLVKIGYTANLNNRIRSYPPGSKLLATETGGPILERRRHRQFAHLLAGGNEWFRPGDDLMAHITELGSRPVVDHRKRHRATDRTTSRNGLPTSP